MQEAQSTINVLPVRKRSIFFKYEWFLQIISEFDQEKINRDVKITNHDSVFEEGPHSRIKRPRVSCQGGRLWGAPH